jgi:hypothetical protein
MSLTFLNYIQTYIYIEIQILKYSSIIFLIFLINYFSIQPQPLHGSAIFK